MYFSQLTKKVSKGNQKRFNSLYYFSKIFIHSMTLLILNAQKLNLIFNKFIYDIRK